VAALKKKLDDFVLHHVIPAEEEYASHMKDRHGADRWSAEALPPCLARLQKQAKAFGLWNMFIPPRLIPHLPDPFLGPLIPVTFREYGILCESLGRSSELAPQACNSSAPDTGNMEVLLEFGSPQQQKDYLLPLLEGKIRSSFLMTEPQVASSDPTNLETKLTKIISQSGAVEYILTGRKWW
jgi:acyl-CoA dehydrogenase